MKRRYGISIGTSSILVIFVVVCLVAFAALSIVSAVSDKKLTQKLADREKAYYEACNEANEDIAKLDVNLRVLRSEASSEDRYNTEIYNLNGYDEALGEVVKLYEISDSQSLMVRIRPAAYGDETASNYEISAWEIITTGMEELDESLPVIK